MKLSKLLACRNIETARYRVSGKSKKSGVVKVRDKDFRESNETCRLHNKGVRDSVWSIEMCLNWLASRIKSWRRRVRSSSWHGVFGPDIRSEIFEFLAH